MNVDRHYRVRIDLESNASGARDTAQAIAETGAAAAGAGRSMDQNKLATDKAFASHRDLRAAVHGLADEFPELGHLGMMAIHPIGLAALAAAGAFKLWEARVSALQELLGGKLDLPAGTAFEPGHISAIAEEWKKYGDAMREAFDKLHSIESRTQIVLSNIEAALKRQQELAAATKAHEDSARKVTESKTTAAGGSDAPAKFAQLQADAQASADKAAADLAAARAKLQAEVDELKSLVAEADSKKAQGKAIHVASAADDAGTLADLKKQADAAKKDREAAQAVIDREGRISADLAKSHAELATGKTTGQPWEASTLDWAKSYAEHMMSGWSRPQIVAAEQNRIETDKAIEAAATRAQKAIPGRDIAREGRTRDFRQAADDEAKAAELRQKIYTERANLDAEQHNKGQILIHENITRLNTALAESIAKLHELRTQAAGLTESGFPVTPQLSTAIQLQQQFNASIQAWLRDLEGQLAHMRTQR